MPAFILGLKSTQSQTFTKEGIRVPTTFIRTTPCFMVGMKWPSKHGYFSVKLGLGQSKNIKKPVRGELEKAGIKTPLRFLREIRLEKYNEKIKLIDEPASAEPSSFVKTSEDKSAGKDKKTGLQIGENKIFPGEEIKASVLFKAGDLIDVTGKSKGKGFQGVVKRHHFKGGPKTHGQSDRLRAPGSIGMTTTPGRVFKGKRMAGRMGGERITIKKLEVIEVRDDGILIKGLVPGHRNSLLEIRSS